MAKASFKKTDKPEETTTNESTDTTVTTRPESQVGAPLPQADDMSGEFNHGDIRLPRINLIHKTSDSEMIEKFGIGGFAFNKEVKLSDGKTPVKITALRMAKDLVQKLPFGDPEEPAVFKTEDDAIKAGFSTNYKDVDTGKFVQRRAHIQIAVEKPEGADEALFPYEFGGKQYGMGMLTVSSSAYTSVAKELTTLHFNNKVMRKGLRYGALDLTSEERRNARNSWRIPVIKYAGENSAELVTFFEGIL